MGDFNFVLGFEDQEYSISSRFAYPKGVLLWIKWGQVEIREILNTGFNAFNPVFGFWRLFPRLLCRTKLEPSPIKFKKMSQCLFWLTKCWV